MNTFSRMLSLIFLIIIYGCNKGPSQEDYNKLLVENNTLKAQLDECQNGAERLFLLASNYYDKGEFSLAIAEINKLLEKHPAFEKIKEANSLLAKCEQKLEAEQIRSEKERKKKALLEKQRLENATKKMRKKYDDIKGITWYYDSSTPKYDNNNNLHLYIGKEKNGLPWLRFRIRYSSDDWLFIENYVIKADDNTFNIIPSYNEVERDNGYGGIWEWYDSSVDKKIYTIINSIINSKSSKLRYNGKQYYKDRVISNQEKRALKNVLDAYEALGGKQNF